MGLAELAIGSRPLVQKGNKMAMNKIEYAAIAAHRALCEALATSQANESDADAVGVALDARGVYTAPMTETWGNKSLRELLGVFPEGDKKVWALVARAQAAIGAAIEEGVW